MRKNYNTIRLSIDKGLSDVKCGTAGDYVMLLDAPAIANVRVKLNDQSSDEIPLKTYHSIEAKGIDVIYVSADAIENETITIVQAKSSNEFKMITPASDVNLKEVSSFSDFAVSQLKFVPDGKATVNAIDSGASTTIECAGIMAIKFNSDAVLGVELNDNGVKFPMNGTNEMILTSINSVTFHNDNTDTTNLKILYMGFNDKLLYILNGYVENGYI